MSPSLELVINRIQKLARATEAAVRSLGLKVFPSSPSPSLTAICLPDAIDGQKLRLAMETKHQVTVMGGQDQLKGKIIRIGHMGYIKNADVEKTIRAFASCLNDASPGLVSETQLESAVQKALSILNSSCSCSKLCFACEPDVMNSKKKQ